MNGKEIHIGDKKFLISKVSNSGFIKASDFTASIRQLEVLHEVVKQGSVRDARTSLGLSEATMRNHITRLRQNMRVNEQELSIEELVTRVRELGLIDQERLESIREMLEVELAHEDAPSRVRRRLQLKF